MHSARSAFDGMTPIAPRSFRLAHSQLLSKAFSPRSASKSRPVDQRLDADAVVTLAGQEDKADEAAERVDQRHDPGGHGRRASGR